MTAAAGLGDIDRGIDGDAHVGHMQRGRVVDAVAHEADDVPLVLQSARMIRCLCAGDRRAKTWVVSTASASSSSVIVSTLPPSRISSAFKPTSRQTLRVTRSLSPVRTFTVTPCFWRASIALAVETFGGSRKAT